MICVFDKDNLNFEGNGNAVLLPTEAKVRSVAGGNYDLTMVHPMEPEGKWRHLVPGAIVRVPIPEEEIENAFSGYEADVYKTTADAELREGPNEPTTITYQTWAVGNSYAVGAKVTFLNKNYTCTYWDSGSGFIYLDPAHSSWWKEIARYTSGSAVLVSLPAGSELYFVQDYDSTWYKMSTYYGVEGYIKKSQVTFYKHLSQDETKPRIIREQLFRITNATADTKSHVVNVTAQHVSYDLNGIIVQDVSIKQASPAMAIGRMVEGFMIPYDGTIATNLTSDDNGTYTDDIKGKTGMYCFLDPDKGIVGKFDAALKRDNWDLFILQKTNTNRGFSIRYRKNLLGVSWARKSDGLITRVVPVAKDEKGDALYLPEKWIDSDYINDYPVIRMERLSMKEQVGKDKGTGDGSTWTLSDLYDEMRAKAAERFTVDKVDRIVDEVTVDFEQLGDTDEHAALKGFEKVLLYDAVTVIHEDIGLNMVMTVNELEWDAIRQKITSVKVSNVGNRAGRSVTGYNVQNKSIGWQKLTDEVSDDILNQVRDIIPEYADPEAPRPAIPVMNTKTQDGYVLKGGSNANKVWGTDDQGNPGWRDEATVSGYIPESEKGAANGVATLDGGGKVPATQLPSYVDDVLEYANTAAFPATGESGKIYVAKDTGFEYRWSGTQYVRLNKYDEATQSASGLMSASDKAKLDGIEAQANKYVLPQATSGALGGIKIGWTGSGKDYPVELDSNGKAHVAVPWTDTTYTLPLAASGTRGGIQIGYTESGKKYAVKLDSEKAYVEVPWTADGGNAATVNGHTVAVDVPSGAKFTDHEYTAGTGLSLSNGQFAVRLSYSASGKNYAVAADGSGNLYVNVPWTDNNTTYSAGTGISISGTNNAIAVQTGYTTSGKNYAVQAGTGGLYVNVPWENTVYSLPLAANGTRGGVQIGYTQSGQNYPVQLSGEKMYVNVPWTDHYAWSDITGKPLTFYNSGKELQISSGNGVNTLNIIPDSPTANTPKVSVDFTDNGIQVYKDTGSGWAAKTFIPYNIVWATVQGKPDTATRWANWGEITQSGANSINSGASDFTDGTELLTSYATDNGFSDPNAVGVVYRRTAVRMYNYVKTKANNETWGNNISGNASSATLLGSATTSKSVTGNPSTAGWKTVAKLLGNKTGKNFLITLQSTYNSPRDFEGVFVASCGYQFAKINMISCTGNIFQFSKARLRREDIENYFLEFYYVPNNGGNVPNANIIGFDGKEILTYEFTDSSGSGVVDCELILHQGHTMEVSGTIGGNISGNADTVDNKHASDFVLKAGDTMTGDLTLSYNKSLKITGAGTTSDSWIIFNDTGGTNCYLGIRRPVANYGATYYDGSAYHTLLHDGNYTKWAVARTGDTMTGHLEIERATEAHVSAKNTTTGIKVAINAGSSGTNHGLESFGYYNGSTFVSDQKWMIYRASNGKIYLDGECVKDTYIKSVGASGDKQFTYCHHGGSAKEGSYDNMCSFPLARNKHALFSYGNHFTSIFRDGNDNIYFSTALDSGYGYVLASNGYLVIYRTNGNYFVYGVIVY